MEEIGFRNKCFRKISRSWVTAHTWITFRRKCESGETIYVTARRNQIHSKSLKTLRHVWRLTSRFHFSCFQVGWDISFIVLKISITFFSWSNFLETNDYILDDYGEGWRSVQAVDAMRFLKLFHRQTERWTGKLTWLKEFYK